MHPYLFKYICIVAICSFAYIFSVHNNKDKRIVSLLLITIGTSHPSVPCTQIYSEGNNAIKAGAKDVDSVVAMIVISDVVIYLNFNKFHFCVNL